MYGRFSTCAAFSTPLWSLDIRVAHALMHAASTRVDVGAVFNAAPSYSKHPTNHQLRATLLHPPPILAAPIIPLDPADPHKPKPLVKRNCPLVIDSHHESRQVDPALRKLTDREPDERLPNTFPTIEWVHGD